MLWKENVQLLFKAPDLITGEEKSRCGKHWALDRIAVRKKENDIKFINIYYNF